MMPYYMLRFAPPEGRGLRENTVYRGCLFGPQVRLEVARGLSVTVAIAEVRSVYFSEDVLPPPCPPMPEQPGEFMVLKLNEPVTYLSYDAAVTAAKMYAAATHNNHMFRVVRVLADVTPPTACVVTKYH